MRTRSKLISKDPVGFDEDPIGFDEDPIGFDEDPIEAHTDPIGFDEDPIESHEDLVGFDEDPIDFDEDPIGSHRDRSRTNKNAIGTVSSPPPSLFDACGHERRGPDGRPVLEEAHERGAHLLRALVTPRRVDGEGVLDGQGDRRFGPAGGCPHRLDDEVLRGSRWVERRAPREGAVEHRPPIDADLAARLLGRDVAGRAEERPPAREGRYAVHRLGGAPRSLRDAEVEDPQAKLSGGNDRLSGSGISSESGTASYGAPQRAEARGMLTAVAVRTTFA
jgi:hypothetical protein